MGLTICLHPPDKGDNKNCLCGEPATTVLCFYGDKEVYAHLCDACRCELQSTVVGYNPADWIDTVL